MTSRECKHGLILGSRCPAGCEGRPRLVLIQGEGVGTKRRPRPLGAA